MRPCLINTCYAVPLPCHEYAVLKATSQGHDRFAAGERHGMCELASAVPRRHVGDLPACGTVGEWQGRGRGTSLCVCELAFNAARRTAWEWHGMCESALTARFGSPFTPTDFYYA
jgi:hypothetical protein